MAKQNPIASSFWSTHRPARSDRPSLDRDRIVAAAIEMLDEDGIDKLSMRRLGSRLGSGATSAYWHVKNKDELLDLVLDATMGQVPLPTDKDWTAALRNYAADLRRVVLSHPWLINVFGSRANLGPNALRLSNHLLGVLYAAGLSTAMATQASSAVGAFVLGATMTEAAWVDLKNRSGMTEQQMEAAMTEFYADQLPGAPHLQQWWAENDASFDDLRRQNFEIGLDALMQGLSLMVSAGGDGRPRHRRTPTGQG